MNKNPIGIIDSGIGGLSVWQEMVKLMPEESTIFPFLRNEMQEVLGKDVHILDSGEAIARQVKRVLR